MRALAIFINLRPLGRDPVVVAGRPLSYSDKVKVLSIPWIREAERRPSSAVIVGLVGGLLDARIVNLESPGPRPASVESTTAPERPKTSEGQEPAHERVD